MWRSLSLTSRLTVFFTLLAAAVILGLGLLFMAAAERHFVELDQAALQDKQHLIKDILAHVHSPDDMRRHLSGALSHDHGLFVLVKDPGGEAVFQSEGFEPPTRQAFAPKSHGDPMPGVWTRRGNEFHTLSFQAAPSYDAASTLQVLIAIDTEHHTQFLSELERSLALYAVLATLASGLLGWLAAHQGLAPLRAMKTRAAVVTGQQLDQRMPVESVPVEMADLAQELNRMLERLQEDFRRLSEFSSDLAHELRTPISNLLTQTQVALSAGRDADTYRDILASNAEEFQRLARMVSDMLFLAKTERGVDLPNKARFSAARESQALLEFYEAVAEEKNVRLSLQGDGDIVGDHLMFRRAVSNLLSNALRHTQEHGEVQIRISETPKAMIVSVENTGDAIDPKVLPRLFDRFYRADPARAHPTSDGAGLGLSITRAIVQAHGGKASVLSSPKRTCFILEFPK